MTEGTYSLPVIETVKAAWAKVGGSKGSIWAIIGILFLVQIIVNVLASFFGHGLFLFIFNLISWLIQIIAAGSLIYLGIRRAQDMPIHYKMANDVLNTPTILSLIGVYFLQMIILIPAGLIAGVGAYFAHTEVEPSSFMRLLTSICFLLAVVWFIFFSVRTWLGFGAVVDKKLNPWDAIKLSFKATKENVLNLIGLYVINIFVALLCAITFGIGLIWGLPWFFINYGEVYKRLSTRQDMRPIG
jgi:uncharacterized membrane protein